MPGIAQELGTVVLQTIAIYIFLIIGLSLLGQRETTQLGPLEIVIIMVLGSAVETSMVAGDTSLLAGLTSAATLLICNRAITRILNRWRWLRRILIGHPVPLVYNGKILTQRMNAAGLSQDDILEGMRERGYDNLDLVRLMVLETDGSISLVPQEAKKRHNHSAGENIRNKRSAKK